VIAAANPIKGKYDTSLSFAENVDLTEPILSRFDALCVVKDEVDLVTDHSLATFVLNSHIRNHPDGITEEMTDEFTGLTDTYHTQPENIFPQALLKKYIMYARQFIKPKLSDID
jgi:DNA replication licensing factor MCM2